jgi:hypothetical protein
MLAVEGVLGLILLAACTALIVRTIPHSSSAPTQPHVATVAADGHTAATLRIVTATPTLTIGLADLGRTGTLLRVSTPPASPAPDLQTVGPAGSAGPAGNPVVDVSAAEASAITVTLNAAVSWQLDLAGGTTTTVADLSGGTVTGIAVTKGANVIDLTLPRPDGSVTLVLGAGASRLALSLPSGVPIRVTAAAGAGAVSLNGQDHVGVKAGTVFMTSGWAPGAVGYDLNATAGAGRITVTTRAS